MVGEGLTCDNIAVKAQGRNMRNGILTRYWGNERGKNYNNE